MRLLVSEGDGGTYFAVSQNKSTSRSYSSLNIQDILNFSPDQTDRRDWWVEVFPFVRWSDEDSSM